MKKLKIKIDTSPLSTGHAIRGIGVYTRLLTKYLEKIPSIRILKTHDFKEKSDLIHYPYFDLYFNSLPLFSKQKSIVTIHDLIPLKFPDKYKPGKKGSLIFKKQKLALRRIDAIVTDSQASKTDIVNLLDVSAEKVHVVYLAGNPNIKKKNKKEVDKIKIKYSLPKKYILYVGDINYNKNIPQLIKATRLLPEDVCLVCVGKNFRPQTIPEWQAIESQIALSNVEEKVKFLTQITGDADHELSALYTGALAYVQASLYEGFGLPVLEAMQCRTPVVCSKNSSLIEVGGKHVVFSKFDYESLAENINHLLSWSKTKRENWARDAYKWSQKFSWEKTAKNTIKVYKKVLLNHDS
ncbi:MAG: glycosyltransferase family 1 protein [Patescibacteria group bacterium]